MFNIPLLLVGALVFVGSLIACFQAAKIWTKDQAKSYDPMNNATILVFVAIMSWFELTLKIVRLQLMHYSDDDAMRNWLWMLLFCLLCNAISALLGVRRGKYLQFRSKKFRKNLEFEKSELPTKYPLGNS